MTVPHLDIRLCEFSGVNSTGIIVQSIIKLEEIFIERYRSPFVWVFIISYVELVPIDVLYLHTCSIH